MDTTTVDPLKIPKKLTKVQLEDWILFGVLVANKEATQTRNKLNALLEALYTEADYALTPFAAVREAVKKGTLLGHLQAIRTGQYGRIERAFREVVEIDADPDTLTVEALEAVHGIGPKTARMIVLYAGPDTAVVPLDTHVLKYLRKLGYENVPKATPSSGAKYRYWESVFIKEAAKARMSVREFDTMVWQMYAKSLNGTTTQRG